MDGITFLGKHSYRDFGLTIKNKSIANPNKIKIKETVPFAKNVYDFSLIYGEQQYEERPLQYTFNLLKVGRPHLLAYEQEISNWLMSSNSKARLVDDQYPATYFLAEVEKATDFSFNWSDGTLTVEFVAYPFKISRNPVGDDIWDTFNFLNDFSAETKFVISGTRQITLYNPSITSVEATVITSDEMIVTIGNSSYLFSAGTTRDGIFTIPPGEVGATIEGNGTIEFIYNYEVI